MFCPEVAVGYTLFAAISTRDITQMRSNCAQNVLTPNGPLKSIPSLAPSLREVWAVPKNGSAIQRTRRSHLGKNLHVLVIQLNRSCSPQAEL